MVGLPQSGMFDHRISFPPPLVLTYRVWVESLLRGADAPCTCDTMTVSTQIIAWPGAGRGNNKKRR